MDQLTNRQTNGQTDHPTDGWTDQLMEGPTDQLAGWLAGRWTGRQVDRHRVIDTHRGRETN